MRGFIPSGFRRLNDFAKDIGVEKVGAMLASGSLAAYRINPWGGMFLVNTDTWRGPHARGIVECGAVQSGRVIADSWEPGLKASSEIIVVKLPKVAPKPTLAISNIAPASTAPKDVAAVGRRTKHDWEGALIVVSAAFFAGDLKDSSSQSDVAKCMADWFSTSGHNVPVDSELRIRAKRILEAMAKA